MNTKHHLKLRKNKKKDWSNHWLFSVIWFPLSYLSNIKIFLKNVFVFERTSLFFCCSDKPGCYIIKGMYFTEKNPHYIKKKKAGSFYTYIPLIPYNFDLKI